jgi:tetratricopeptide (TPR) repeat protein
LAEVFYGLGEALSSEGGTSIGVIYLQLALMAAPDHPFGIVALGQAYESAKKHAEANAVYERVPAASPLTVNIAIQKAFNFAAIGKVDEAKALLDQVIAEQPKDIRPLDALGNILRSEKRYAEAERYYTKAIALIPNPDKRHWAYFYSRGTCYERLKKWPAAEADLKKAMRLSPDQPLVLNYLGYSWIDQNRNLKQGLKLIEKAVQLKPDDFQSEIDLRTSLLGDDRAFVRHRVAHLALARSLGGPCCS